MIEGEGINQQQQKDFVFLNLFYFYLGESQPCTKPAKRLNLSKKFLRTNFRGQIYSQIFRGVSWGGVESPGNYVYVQQRTISIRSTTQIGVNGHTRFNLDT